MGATTLPPPTNAAGELVVEGTCSQCGETKPAAAFTCEWDRKKTRRKLRSWCRACRAAYDHEQRKDPAVLERRARSHRRYFSTPHGKAARAKGQRAYTKREYNRAKIKARMAVQMAIRRGDLVYTGVCEHCHKKRKTGYHHEDYTKELDVEELCKKCHDIADRKLVSAEQGSADKRG